MKRWFLSSGIILILVVLALQLLPYGRDHSNPSVRQEPAWDSPQTRELAAWACFDCHSNQTVWPWYSNIAPVSWIIERDVRKGRKKLNFSEWDRPQEEADESAESIQKGKMPPWYYPWAHLSGADREALVRGLGATVGENGGRGEEKERFRD
ncbi:MAG: heme-binding domain-containing protein [Deltaproteobacteria bacterium]|nr:heme-binding domain-containing protein [Deltaproteobacteria bacterium]